MTFAETTETNQVEIKFFNGAPAYLMREKVYKVLRDGLTISSSIHRESYSFDSDEARAVLGDALAAALAQVEALTAERDGALDQIAHLEGQLATANARVAELEAAATATEPRP